MSVFSDYLNKIREDHHLKVIEFAKLCHLDVSTASRWCNGKRLPASHEVIEIITECLHLSHKEALQLERAYLETIFGEERYNNYKIIQDLIPFLEKESSLSTKRGAYYYTQSVRQDSLFFEHCNNHVRVLEEIDNIIANTDSEETLYLKIADPTLHIVSVLTRQILLAPKRKVEILFVFSEVDLKNTGLLSTLIKSIVEIMIHCENIAAFMLDGEVDTYFRHENWIFTEKLFLHFDQEMQQGATTNYPAYIGNQTSQYKELKKYSHEIANKYLSVLDYPETFYQRCHIDVAEYMPCLTQYMDYDLLNRVFFPEIPGREGLIKSILDNYNMDQFDVHNVCTEQGLRYFMEHGILTIFPYPIYRPFTMNERIMLLEQLIHSIDKGYYTQRFLKKQIMHKYPVVQINLFEDEISAYVSVLLIEGKELNTQRLIFRHPGILQCVKDYFEVVKHERFTYTKEESREILVKVVEEYREAFSKQNGLETINSLNSENKI